MRNLPQPNGVTLACPKHLHEQNCPHNKIHIPHTQKKPADGRCRHGPHLRHRAKNRKATCPTTRSAWCLAFSNLTPTRRHHRMLELSRNTRLRWFPVFPSEPPLLAKCRSSSHHWKVSRQGLDPKFKDNQSHQSHTRGQGNPGIIGTQ